MLSVSRPGSAGPIVTFGIGIRLAAAVPRVAALARGIAQHHADDAWFHSSAAFAELSWRFTAQLRDVLAPDEGMRPSFLGHILVEILLDAELIARRSDVLARYYDALDRIAAVDPTPHRLQEGDRFSLARWTSRMSTTLSMS